MLNLKRILLALDLSKSTANIITIGHFLARYFDAKIILLHIVEDDISSYHGYVPRGSSEKLREHISEKMDHLGKEIEIRGLIKPEVIIREGVADQVLLTVAEDFEIDIMVMGAVKHSIIDKILGTTAEKILRQSPFPIWFIPPDTSVDQFTSLLCALDCSAGSRSTLNTAIALARELEATLNIFHAMPFPITETLYGNNVWPYFLESDLNYSTPHNNTENELRKFEDYLQTFDLSGIEHRHTFRYGNAAEEIETEVKNVKPDLLIMGANEKNEHFIPFISGTIEKVLNHTPCSLLSMKHPHKEDEN